MNITKVQIHYNKRGTPPAIKAWADIILDEVFIVRSLAIVHKLDGDYYIVTMPSKERKDSRSPSGFSRIDIAHPITKEYHAYLEKTILDAYEDFLTEMATRKPNQKENL